MKGLVAWLAVALLVSGSPERVQAAESSLEQSFVRFYQAVNGGDGAAAAALFAEDGVLITGGACSVPAPCTGRPDIQRGLASIANLRASFGIVDKSMSGNVIEASLETWHVNVQNFGFERIITKARATYAGDKIQRLVHEVDLTDPQSAEFARYQAMLGLVDAHTNLLNRGDPAGMLALYADDGVFEGFGLCAAAPCRGKSAIQAELERQVEDRASLFTAIPGARRTGSGVSNQRAMRSDSIRASGADRIFLAVSIEAANGKITRLRWIPMVEDAQTASFLAAGAPAAPARLPAAGDMAPLPWLLAAAVALLLVGLALRRSVV